MQKLRETSSPGRSNEFDFRVPAKAKFDLYDLLTEESAKVATYKLSTQQIAHEKDLSISLEAITDLGQELKGRTDSPAAKKDMEAE